MNTSIFKVIKSLSLCVMIIFWFKTNLIASEIKIISKINNNIITNYDVEKEFDYLRALNSKGRYMLYKYRVLPNILNKFIEN